jgi:nicotinamide riboside kinase
VDVAAGTILDTDAVAASVAAAVAASRAAHDNTQAVLEGLRRDVALLTDDNVTLSLTIARMKDERTAAQLTAEVAATEATRVRSYVGDLEGQLEASR